MLTVAGIAVGSLVAYAVYFDYKRKTDATFRRRLRMLVLFQCQHETEWWL